MQAETLTTAAGVPLQGPLLLTPRVFGDDRGFFFESWNQRSFVAALGLPVEQAPAFVQDNHSRSSRGVLRGLHYQLPPHPLGKLVLLKREGLDCFSIMLIFVTSGPT